MLFAATKVYEIYVIFAKVQISAAAVWWPSRYAPSAAVCPNWVLWEKTASLC